ncbi:MAG: hypothetical protein ACTHMS_18530, partial [Jatrophihabitans sp.]
MFELIGVNFVARDTRRRPLADLVAGTYIQRIEVGRRNHCEIDVSGRLPGHRSSNQRQRTLLPAK